MGKQAKLKWQRRAAENPPWTPLERAYYDPDELKRIGLNVAPICYRNSRYQVTVRMVGATAQRPGMVHLSIKRNDRQPIHDWRDLQRIKNELCGAEREAVEIYPAEKRCVDEANQYHLWVFPEGYRIPFGFADRYVSDTPFLNSVQRPFEPGSVIGEMNTPHSPTASMREI